MLGLGLASSHAPAMFCPKEVWPKAYMTNMPDYMIGSQPHTAKLETMEVIEGYIKRIDAGFNTLKAQIEAYKPDALIMIGDDQYDMFNASNNPQICIYTGESIWGMGQSRYMELPPEKCRIDVPVHAPLAKYLLKTLVKRGFDISQSAKMQPMGPHPERGTSHMVTLPLPRLTPKLNVPVIPIFLNEYFPPMPTGRRCWDLGVAIQEVLRDRPERIAIYASGGLSHDPNGPRCGWIDEPLDRWVLERIEQNKGVELANLFSFDSASLRGGAGEIRAWISVAGACQRPGVVVDYIPAHHTKTGLGFCYWPV
jgi:Catalytic LigB subunit of aromatic ring-opening dioxygenase